MSVFVWRYTLAFTLHKKPSATEISPLRTSKAGASVEMTKGKGSLKGFETPFRESFI